MIIAAQASLLDTGSRPVCAAIGVFDGVHVGHQEVIRQTLEDARLHDALPVIVTFDRHPASVLATRKIPGMIYSLEHKIRVLSQFDPAALLLLHFDLAFSQKSAQVFIEELVRGFGRVNSIRVGTNFRFGHQRSGNLELLNRLAGKFGYKVHGIPPVTVDGHRVSSTRIREAIEAGQLDPVHKMLGRPYSIFAPVVQGDQLGRKLGFPTANLDTNGLILPPRGVYAARVYAQGLACNAVLNMGVRPTLELKKPPLRVEAHLLDFEGDLYGRKIETVLVQMLRPEQQFPSLDALKLQIARDIEAARLVLAASQA
jgi:riboflavin kinase/FMN adenylyltransferase